PHTMPHSAASTLAVTTTFPTRRSSAPSTNVVVQNAAPVITASSVQVDQATINENGSVTLTGSFTDIGSLDTHTVSIVWGDGQTTHATVTRINANDSFTAYHQFL